MEVLIGSFIGAVVGSLIVFVVVELFDYRS